MSVREEGRINCKYNVASYQAQHCFTSHEEMQLVLEKNKERRNLPPGFILSHVSCRATPTGPLSQYLHVACWSPGPFCHLEHSRFHASLCGQPHWAEFCCRHRLGWPSGRWGRANGHREGRMVRQGDSEEKPPRPKAVITKTHQVFWWDKCSFWWESAVQFTPPGNDITIHLVTKVTDLEDILELFLHIWNPAISVFKM